MRLTDGSPRARLACALDLVALVVFIAAGMRNHRTGSQVDIFLRNAVPVLAAWLVSSVLWRTYRPVSWARLFLTWLTAVPLGLLVRTWWVGSPTGGRIAVFLGVGLAFTALFLLIGRALGSLVVRRLPQGGSVA
jgi:hypothetical protein